MARHGEGELVLTQEYFPGIFLFEKHRLFLAVRAHHRLDARVHRARDLNHAAHVKRVRGGDHQHARPLDMRLNEDGGLGSIARDGRYAAVAPLLDDLTILLGHYERYALISQRFTDAPADAAIAHQDNLS